MKHTVRHKNHGVQGSVDTVEIDGYTRGLAIKMFCTSCLGHEINPSECTSELCELYPYRGKSQKAWAKEA